MSSGTQHYGKALLRVLAGKRGDFDLVQCNVHSCPLENRALPPSPSFHPSLPPSSPHSLPLSTPAHVKRVCLPVCLLIHLSPASIPHTSPVLFHCLRPQCKHSHPTAPLLFSSFQIHASVTIGTHRIRSNKFLDIMNLNIDIY